MVDLNISSLTKSQHSTNILIVKPEIGMAGVKVIFFPDIDVDTH